MNSEQIFHLKDEIVYRIDFIPFRLSSDASKRIVDEEKRVETR